MKCEFVIDGKECGREFSNFYNLSNHIAQGHKNQIALKDYYDKYMRKDINEEKCIKCGKETKFKSLRDGYLKHCSYKCSANDVYVRKQYIQTIQENNTKDSNRLKKIEEKRIRKCKEKYGVEYVFQSTNFKEKSEKKNKNKYGFSNASQSPEIKEKIRLKSQKNWGTDHPSQTKEFHEKRKLTEQELNKKNPNRSKEILEKTKQTRIKNGTMMSDDQLSNLQIYQRSVFYFTNLSIKKKYSKEELEKRKLAGINDAFHIDHRFSIKEGFKQNILPCIIGCQFNLEFLPWLDNYKKHTKCSITKEELFKLYEQEIKELSK